MELIIGGRLWKKWGSNSTVRGSRSCTIVVRERGEFRSVLFVPLAAIKVLLIRITSPFGC